MNRYLNTFATVLATAAAKKATRAQENSGNVKANSLFVINKETGALQEIWLEGQGETTHLVYGNPLS